MSLCHEVWKPVAGYEGLYEVSNLGRVKTIARKVNRINRGEVSVQETIMKPSTITRGYKLVGLRKNGVRKGCTIHRLVAEAFIPNPDDLPQVNHKDGNKANNSADNLEWCTAQDNMLHSLDIGLRSDAKRVDMYSKSGELVCSFKSINEAGRKTGISEIQIGRCCKGKYGRKTAGGFIWKYSEGGESNVS